MRPAVGGDGESIPGMTNRLNMKKVIGFDSWTGGAQNFERVASALAARGVEFLVVHIGSWGGDAGRAEQEQVGAVRYRDIRAYGSNRLDDVLAAEQPDAVLFLSTDTFAHRAFNRLCRRRGIPTLHLYHGLVSVQEVGPVRAYKVNLLSHAKFVLERIPKALRYIWPAYGASLLRTGGGLRDWGRFLGDILVMASGRRPHTAAPDARTSKCCVYVVADVAHAVQRYGFESANVVPVGNPDLARFGLDERTVGSQLSGTGGRTDVMYVDTGLVYTGFVFNSAAQFLRHLVDTRDALAKQGRRLVFKPHPDHARTTMLDDLRAAGVELCSNAEFIPRLLGCCAAIVEPTSLAVVPALVGLPLFLAQYGPLAGQRYGTVLTSYARHRPLTDLGDFDRLLKSENTQLDVGSARAWIDDNAGPLPSDAMPDRVVDVIQQLAATAQADRSRPTSETAEADRARHAR